MMKRALVGVVLGMVMMMALAGVSTGKGGERVIENGKKVTFDYTLTVDGKVVDSSKAHGPFQYMHGEKNIIPGLSKQLEGLRVGDEKAIVVAPEDAYGPIDPSAFQDIPRSRLPKEIDLHVGTQLQASSPDGKVLLVTVSQLKGDQVELNFNHPLAGKELHFQVKVVNIQ